MNLWAFVATWILLVICLPVLSGIVGIIVTSVMFWDEEESAEEVAFTTKNGWMVTIARKRFGMEKNSLKNDYKAISAKTIEYINLVAYI